MVAPDSIDGLRVHLEQFIKARFGNETSNDVIRKAVLSDPALATLSRPDLEAALEQVLTASQRPRLLVDWGELPQVGRQARPLFTLIALAPDPLYVTATAVQRSAEKIVVVGDAERTLRSGGKRSSVASLRHPRTLSSPRQGMTIFSQVLGQNLEKCSTVAQDRP